VHRPRAEAITLVHGDETTSLLENKKSAAAVVLGLQLALFVALGLPDGALGVAWPSMRGAFERPLGDLGLVLAVGTLGYLTGSTSAAALARRFGTPRTMAASSAGAAAAFVVWVATNSWVVMLAAAVVLGLSRGVVDAGMNAYVALHGGVRRLGLLHGSYGIGTSLGPVLVVASLALGSWRPAWIAIGAFDLAVAVVGWRTRNDWEPDVAPDRQSIAGPDATRASRLTVPVLLLCFAVLVGAEYSTGAWSYTLLTEARGQADTPGGLWVASYWAGLTVSRFVLGAVGDRFGRIQVLHASCALALASVTVLWWDPGGLGAIGLPLAGFGFGSIFPTMVALTPDRLGAHRSSAVIGWAVAAASIGGAAVAALAGVLADRYGPAILAPVFVVATGALGALHLLLVRLAPVSPRSDRRPVVA
jgi:fucose permease